MSYVGICEVCGKKVTPGFVKEGLHTAMVRHSEWVSDEDNQCGGVVLNQETMRPLEVEGCSGCDACVNKRPSTNKGLGCVNCGHYSCPQA